MTYVRIHLPDRELLHRATSTALASVLAPGVSSPPPTTARSGSAEAQPRPSGDRPQRQRERTASPPATARSSSAEAQASPSGDRP